MSTHRCALPSGRLEQLAPTEGIASLNTAVEELGCLADSLLAWRVLERAQLAQMQAKPLAGTATAEQGVVVVN
jgi:hypothetical protein